MQRISSLLLRRPSTYRAMSTTPIELTVISDSICPWCYMGYKKLNKAIELAKAEGLPYEFSMKFAPFQLDPTLPTDRAIPKSERYAQKFGEERFKQMEAAMKERGQAYGINFSYGGSVRQTTSSHRLLALAYEKGGEPAQRKLVERFFSAYFENEQDIGDPDVLARAVVDADIGVTRDEVLAYLKSDAGMDDYNAGLKTARMLAVTGVPFTIINNRVAVSGAQDPENFLEAFKQAVAAK